MRDVSDKSLNKRVVARNAPVCALHESVVQALLARLELADVVEEARNANSAVGVGEARQDTDEVVERLGRDTSPQAGVQVRVARFHLDTRVDYAAQAEGQAGNVLAQPVRVADENHVDVADEVLPARRGE